MVYHDLMAHSVLMDRFKTSLDRDQDSKHHDLAMNIKYGIYSFLIWICYHHQFTPKPVITFFDPSWRDTERDDVPMTSPNPQRRDHDAKRQKLIDSPSPTKSDGDGEGTVFETLHSVKERVTELSIANSLIIQWLVTMVCGTLLTVFTVLTVLFLLNSF